MFLENSSTKPCYLGKMYAQKANLCDRFKTKMRNRWEFQEYSQIWTSTFNQNNRWFEPKSKFGIYSDFWTMWYRCISHDLILLHPKYSPAHFDASLTSVSLWFLSGKTCFPLWTRKTFTNLTLKISSDFITKTSDQNIPGRVFSFSLFLNILNLILLSSLPLIQQKAINGKRKKLVK